MSGGDLDPGPLVSVFGSADASKVSLQPGTAALVMFGRKGYWLNRSMAKEGICLPPPYTLEELEAIAHRFLEAGRIDYVSYSTAVQVLYWIGKANGINP